MEWLQAFAAEFAIAAADPTVWLSIGEGLVFGGVCLLFGIWVARLVGLLAAGSPAGEVLGVGLASGLLVLAAWWAALASGGRSSFTPVAVGFAIAIALAVVRRVRRSVIADPVASEVPAVGGDMLSSPSTARRNIAAAVLGGALFVAMIALAYGSTLTLSPRDGIQPVDFNDTAYYAVLGRDLARSGTEAIYSPSGFSGIQGVPTQTWYHWGEMWLAAAAITIFGTTPLEARHFIVLPLLLLAAAALTGTVVRRISGSSSRGAFLFGFFAYVFLAPVPLIPGPFFSSWVGGLIFGITSYGLAAVAVLHSMYGLVVLGGRPISWALAIFAGSAAATILPAHVAIALLAGVGVASVGALRIGQSLLASRRLPIVLPIWQRTIAATSVALAVTVIWALLTGHGIGNSALSLSVLPFNETWRQAVAITTICSGAFLAIILAWFMSHKDAPVEASLYLGAIAILIVGAIVWGARLGDFDTVHLFYGGIAVFGTPVAAVAVWSIWRRLRVGGHRGFAVALLVLCITQIEIGLALGIVRLESFGPGRYPPVSQAILSEIGGLPQDAVLAYACNPSEEVVFWNARLVAIDARMDRRIVPMCFEAEVAGELVGGEMSPDIANPVFHLAPQHALYPDSRTRPSAAEVVVFLKANGIDYIYADATHPNTLVPDASLVATDGETQVLRIP